MPLMDTTGHLVGCLAEDACPSPTAHKRLEAAHLQWHRCLDAYYDPQLFMMDLNSLIASLRNVTFAIQKDMTPVEGFREWYQPWQDAMRRDPVMKWAIDARNTVVKEGDLETNSEVEARVVFTYWDAADIMKRGLQAAPDKGEPVATELMHTKDQILERAATRGWPDDLIDDALVVIERRWVDKAFHQVEILEAAAHVISFLSSLLQDMDEQFAPIQYDPGLDPGTVGTPESLYPDKARPMCMMTTRPFRSIVTRLKDGDTDVTGAFMPHEDPPAGALQAMGDKYRKHVREGTYRISGDPIEVLPWFLEMGRAILLSGDSHGWMVFLFKGGKLLRTFHLAARDKADKYSLSIQVADTVIALGADGVLMVAESWLRTPIYNDRGVMVGATKAIGEMLVFDAMTKDGREESWVLPFTRNAFGLLTVQDPIKDDGRMMNFLAPVRAAWGLTIATSTPHDGVDPDN